MIRWDLRLGVLNWFEKKTIKLIMNPHVRLWIKPNPFFYFRFKLLHGPKSEIDQVFAWHGNLLANCTVYCEKDQIVLVFHNVVAMVNCHAKCLTDWQSHQLLSLYTGKSIYSIKILHIIFMICLDVVINSCFTFCSLVQWVFKIQSRT